MHENQEFIARFNERPAGFLHFPFKINGIAYAHNTVKVMLCDICGVREATIHKTAPNVNVSTVPDKTMPIRHYCTRCFEKAFNKSEYEESEQERETPHTPV